MKQKRVIIQICCVLLIVVFSTTGFTRDVKNKFSSFKTLEEPLKLVVEKYLKMDINIRSV